MRDRKIQVLKSSSEQEMMEYLSEHKVTKENLLNDALSKKRNNGAAPIKSCGIIFFFQKSN